MSPRRLILPFAAACACCLAALGGSSVQVAGAASSVLEVASGGGNVWVVTRDPVVVGRWRLLHHSGAMGGDHARISRSLQARPLAIAARDDQVLVAMPSTPQP